MFGRGTWAIVGVEKESLDAFRTNLADRLRMIAVSQLAASTVTRHTNTDALGINPFSAPRLDEQQEALALDQERLLVQYATTEPGKRDVHTLPPEVVEHEGYAFGGAISNSRGHSLVRFVGGGESVERYRRFGIG